MCFSFPSEEHGQALPCRASFIFDFILFLFPHFQPFVPTRQTGSFFHTEDCVSWYRQQQPRRTFDLLTSSALIIRGWWTLRNAFIIWFGRLPYLWSAPKNSSSSWALSHHLWILSLYHRRWGVKIAFHGKYFPPVQTSPHNTSVFYGKAGLTLIEPCSSTISPPRFLLVVAVASRRCCVCSPPHPCAYSNTRRQCGYYGEGETGPCSVAVAIVIPALTQRMSLLNFNFNMKYL